MAISQAMCTSFKSEILDEQHDLVADTIKMSLHTSSASLGASTTAYASSGLSEVSGTGYSSGGVELTSRAVGTSGTTAYFDFADPSWTSASFTARGLLLYNTTAITGFTTNRSILAINFGGDKTVTSGTFTIEFPAAAASTAIIQLA